VIRLAWSLVALAISTAGAEDRCPAGGSWPDTDWPSAAQVVRSARPAEAAALDAYAFTPAGLEASRRGIRTDGLLVVQRGVVTYERYGRGFGPATPHLAWSVAKSVTGALAAVAVGAGALSTDDSICKHLPAAPRWTCDISVRDLLESASGLDWNERYEGGALQDSSVLAMLYGQGRRDMVSFVLSHRRRAGPGEQWRYSSADAVLLAAVADRAMVSHDAEADWPFQRLFQPLGMASAVFERDAAGSLVGSSYFYATPRDLARLGWLFLEDGCWRGREILPAGWMGMARQVSAPFRMPGEPRRRRDGAWGRDLWLNRAVPEVGLEKPWPGAPDDAFAARGHWGQEVVVIPSLEMVVVRTGDDREAGALDLGKLVSLAVAAGRLP